MFLFPIVLVKGSVTLIDFIDNYCEDSGKTKTVTNKQMRNMPVVCVKPIEYVRKAIIACLCDSVCIVFLYFVECFSYFYILIEEEI